MWEQIRSNRRKTIILVAMMALLLFLVGYFLGEMWAPHGGGRIGLAAAFLLWIILSLVAYYQGGKIMLALSGAKPLSKEDHPQLYNVVQEMQIASGLPVMPAIYIIDDDSPNAFATGRDPQHAAVAVTTGLLKVLSRDELQGVIAHELAHIQNRDVLLMIMVGVMMGVIVLLADVWRRSLFFGGSRRSRTASRGGGGAQAIIMVVGILLVILAPLFAQLLYFAVSRRREYLADAMSAQFTRYPEGLANALEKISVAPVILASANRVTAPMYIINPLKRVGRKAADISSTHPPTSERVRILRAMAGGVSLEDYNRVWQKLHGGAALIKPGTRVVGVPSTATAKAVAGGMGVVGAAAVAGRSAPVGVASRPAQAIPDTPEEQRKRARQTTDAMWRMQGYRFITCPCGAKLKLPPTFKEAKVTCPHCNRIHPVPPPGTKLL